MMMGHMTNDNTDDKEENHN